MPDSTSAMQAGSVRFLDFPREIRDAVYVQVFCRYYTVRIPKHLSQHNISLNATAQESDSSHACNASTSDTTGVPLQAPSHYTCEEPAPNVKASPSSGLAILQTSKRVNEEATQQLYAAGCFIFPSDVLMEKDLSLLGHKLKLLRDIELNFALDWEGDRYGMDELDSLTAVMNANCKANIKFLAADKESRHYYCTLVFENCLNICLKKPSQIGWWDLLE